MSLSRYLRFGSTYSGLPRSIYVLFIVRIINAMGNFVYPFLTLFLAERVGLSTGAIGGFFLISALSQGIGSLVGGKLTDHFGRKKLLITFNILSALCFFPCPFLGNSILIPVLLIIAGAFAGASQPVSSAMVADLTDGKNRKQAFSLLYMGINIGFAIGPMIAGFLYRNYTNWIFYGNAFAIIISTILLILFAEETMHLEKEIDYLDVDDSEVKAEKGSVFAALSRRPILVMFSLGRFIYQLVYSCIGFTIPLQMKSVFGAELGPQNFGIMMSFTGLVVILFTTILTRITIKLKPLTNMTIAGFFYAIGFGMIGVIHSLPMYILAAFIFTIGEILDATNAGVYIANSSPINQRGRFSAVVNLISGTGFALGPYIFGKLIPRIGLSNIWIIYFILTFISGVFMFWLKYFETKHNEKNSKIEVTT